MGAGSYLHRTMKVKQISDRHRIGRFSRYPAMEGIGLRFGQDSASVVTGRTEQLVPGKIRALQETCLIPAVVVRSCLEEPRIVVGHSRRLA